MTKISVFLGLLIACMAVTTITAQKPRYENPTQSFCARTKDLFSSNGRYIKTVCMSLLEANYEEGRRRCAANNMNLFIIDDKEVEVLFQDAISYLYPDHPQGYLWINGKRQNNSNKWEINNPDGTIQGPLPSGLNFYSHRALGYCLQYNAQNTAQYRPLASDCNAGKVVACEHHKRTQDPPKLEPSECTVRKDLYYNGKYLKSMCAIFENHNFDNARRRCAKIGMNLFTFDNAITDQVFNEANEDFFRTYPASYFWINGKRDCHSNQWKILNSNGNINGTLYDGIEWVKRRGYCGRTFGNCLKLTGQLGPYQAMGNYCYDAFPIMCEYTY